jgi:thiol-disulfide isomerase/thioredoxin
VSRTCDELAILGKPAVDFQVESWFQSPAKLGREPTLIVFFETWCPHCRREVPRLQELHTTYAGRMAVIAVTKVNRSSTDDAVREFIAEHGLTFPIGKERSGLMSEYYAVSGIPAAVLLKGGEVAWRGHPARLNDDLLDALLAP